MRDIPLVDISDVATAIPAIESACRDIGFMYVVGHGIAPDTIAQIRAAVVDYFALPLAEKHRGHISRDNYRGYIPAGFFSANSGDAVADNYEGYKLHFEVPEDDPVRALCDLYGPNKWPDQPSHFRKAVLRYWNECDRISTMLLTAMAGILGTRCDQFLRMFESPLTNMTLLHYAPQAPDTNGFGIHPHKDTDALTIVAPDPVGGLFVKRRNEQGWITADAPDNALIVNIGDLLELWSGGYFVSTPHKVVNTSSAERYSFPFFVVPRFDTVVRPLRSPQPGFRRDEVHVGDVSREVWRTNWPHTKSDKLHFDLGTLQD
ncbi:MAG: isopenicillin N synthase family oxygenase [Woeseiaceae bacterium]|nr:isopenicillin N synthase family oxygenase [Woeseiaceae bacterium]